MTNWYGMCSIAIGLVASFCVFWNLQFCLQHWRWWWWVSILAISFVLIAYGSGVVLDALATDAFLGREGAPLMPNESMTTHERRIGKAPTHSDAEYLDFDPGAGDDFPATVECRKTALIVTRHEHQCFGTRAGGQHMIPKGTRVYRETGKCEGSFGTVYICLRRAVWKAPIPGFAPDALTNGDNYHAPNGVFFKCRAPSKDALIEELAQEVERLKQEACETRRAVRHAVQVMRGPGGNKKECLADCQKVLQYEPTLSGKTRAQLARAEGER